MTEPAHCSLSYGTCSFFGFLKVAIRMPLRRVLDYCVSCLPGFPAVQVAAAPRTPSSRRRSSMSVSSCDSNDLSAFLPRSGEQSPISRQMSTDLGLPADPRLNSLWAKLGFRSGACRDAGGGGVGAAPGPSIRSSNSFCKFVNGGSFPGIISPPSDQCYPVAVRYGYGQAMDQLASSTSLASNRGALPYRTSWYHCHCPLHTKCGARNDPTGCKDPSLTFFILIAP